MPQANTRLYALIAMGLMLFAAPGLRAQNAPAIRGDVDGDGRVTRADADAVRAYLVRGTLPGGRSILPAGDANGDGRVTAADAALISRFAAGVDVSRFPVGQPIDGTGRVPTQDGAGTLLTQYECEVTVESGATACRLAIPEANGAQLDIIIGTPYVTVGATKVVSNGDPNNPDTTTTTLTLTSNIPQPIGTTDGTTLHPNGIRMVFTSGPTVTQVSSGSLSTAKAWFDPTTDSATFTSAQGVTYTNKKYIQFNEILQQDSSATQSVRVLHDPNVVKFAIGMWVATPVQFEHGWIDVMPATAPVIAPDSTSAFTGVVRDQVGVVQADGITWSSSNTAVAAVDASGVVTGVGEGTATITATSTVNAQRTGSRSVTVDRFPQVDSTSPADNAENVVPGTDILIYFSEPVTASTASFDLECPAGSAKTFTVSGSGTSAITVSPDADLPPGTTCVVTVKGNQIEDVDTNDGPNFMPGQYVFDFLVGIEAVADVFGTTTTGNVRINSASTDPVFSVTTNDKLGPTTTISFAGWGGVAGKTMGGGDVVMDTEGAGMGTFTYNPPAGFEGTDSLEYTVQQGSMTSTARVALPVSGMIWFVNNAGAACTTRASGCGRLTNPYSSLAAFQAENNGTGNNPAAGDNVFLYQSATPYTGPVTLLGQQKLIGQDAGASLSTITGITPATGSDALPAMDPAGDAVTINGGSGGVVLANIGATSGANNTVRGLTIATTGGAGLSGTSFGSPVIEEVPISVTGGPSLSLNGGTVNSTFSAANSFNSATQGLSLTNVDGTLTFGAGAMLYNSTGTAFFVSGGAPAITYDGGIHKDGASAGRLVDISGTTGGTITFETGTLSSTSSAGTGIQLSSAAGTVNFNSSTTLNGGDAGIDIVAGSTGTFSFGASTLVQNPTGTAFSVNGGAPSVTYDGGITKNGASAGRLVDISGTTGGTITFQTGTLNSLSSAGTGIQLSNAAGTVNFNGTTVLSGGDAGIDIVSGSTGTFTFGAGALVQNPTGTAFTVNGSAPAVTFNGSLIRTVNNALLVDLTTVGGGTITFDPAAGTDSLHATTGDGILLSNVDGAVDFNGRVRLAGGNAGVDVVGGSSGNIDFDAATIVNPSGEALRIFNGGAAADVAFAGSIATSTGRPVLVEGVNGGTVAVSASISATGQGILVQNNTGGTVTFSSATQTLNTGTNAAVSLLNNLGATISFTGGALDIDVTSGAGFNATGGGWVNVTGAGNTVTSTAGGRTVNIQNTSIGGSNVTFRSVTGTGAASGVRVENTGTLGGFRITGDGSTAGSGGTITLNAVTAADSAAYTLTGTASASLEFVRVEVTTGAGATGIAASNLQGTSLVRNSVFDYNQTPPDAVALHNAYGARFVQNNTNATITLDGVTINGMRSGAAAGVLSARGSSVVTFNVVDSNTGDGFQSLFTDLFGSGWAIGAGDNAGSTAVVSLTVRDSRFTDAAPNGTNNLEMSVSQSATLDYRIKDNLFQDVGHASANAGIIDVQTLQSGRFGSSTAMDSIVGNTITSSGTAVDPGHIGIRVALANNVTGIQHRVVIAGNTITDLWRQGMHLSSRGSNDGYHVRVENNTVGTAALPVGQLNRRGVEVDVQASAQMNIEVLNNSIHGAGTTDAAAALALRTGIVAGTATLNATVVGNTLRSTSAGTTGRFRAETAGTGTGVMCLDLRSNNLEDNSRTYRLLHTAGTFRVEGAGTGAVTNAAIQAANSGGNGSVGGTVLYNDNVNCQQPAGL
jgi:Bacterial Ig-like domain/Dockerin type I domain/Bacterial Ig-like domain (group 2)